MVGPVSLCQNKRSPICCSTSRQCVRACSAHSPAGSPDNGPRRAPASCTRRMRVAPASGQISRAQVRRDGRPFAASTGTSPDRDLQTSHAAPSRRRDRATPTDRITVSDGEDKGERTPSRRYGQQSWSAACRPCRTERAICGGWFACPIGDHPRFLLVTTTPCSSRFAMSFQFRLQ